MGWLWGKLVNYDRKWRRNRQRARRPYLKQRTCVHVLGIRSERTKNRFVETPFREVGVWTMK